MKRCALVITGGNAPSNLSQLRSLPSYSYICAADSGLDTAAQLHLDVDYAIGDFDSIKDHQLLDKVDHDTLSVEKDDSDTEALLSHLRIKGFDEYILVGGGEGRFDHLFHLYSLFHTFSPPIVWITAKEKMVRIDSQKIFSLPAHTTVSILPSLTTGVSRVSCSQLRWPLTDFLIDSLHMSLSNKVITPSDIEITVSGDPIFLCINHE